MTTEKQPITAYVPETLADRVREAARQKRVTVSEYIRRILERQFKLEAVEPKRGRPPKDEEPTQLSA